MSAVATQFPPGEPLFRLSIDQYHSLVRSGILTTDDRVEFLEGILFRKMSKNPPHSNCNGRVQQAIGALIPRGWCFRQQEPITLGDSEPEPDGAIVRGSIDSYITKHPVADETALVIEVADTSLEKDRGIKFRTYARADIACYWIINLVEQQIETYTDPDSALHDAAYKTFQVFKRGQSVPIVLEGRLIAEIPVENLLPALV